MPELSWKHHTLIQSLLSRGPLKAEEFNKIFEGVTGRNPGSNDKLFNDYLLKINKELSFVQFELRACRNQYDGTVYYGVVNNTEDEQSKLGSKYSVPQIAFYKGIIEAIAQDAAGQGCITNIDALHIRLDSQIPGGSQPQSESQLQDVPPALRNFSMSQKEKALEELVHDGWLSNVDGNIGLGIRSFLDLRSWFRLNEIPSCEVCNEAGVKADLCPTEGCPIRIHKYCLLKKFSQRTAEKVCPGCHNPWPYTVTKAEMVDNEDEPSEPTETQPSNGPSQRKRRKNSQSQTQESDNVGSGSSRTTKLRRSSRIG
ncbi:non-structural maintenance of chromosomes element 1 homolog [Chenopodium quinoa]|uniref:Non-structural maintenance of chromosomes element 1 homolog n=1 Tax=Chenopodium quinoa TaxID=63459 RepID=A0A803KRF8_CHEQI|nr:non-structural maintenance of chromosomes element 1 homolog [Chenopodium quinoa]